MRRGSRKDQISSLRQAETVSKMSVPPAVDVPPAAAVPAAVPVVPPGIAEMFAEMGARLRAQAQADLKAFEAKAQTEFDARFRAQAEAHAEAQAEAEKRYQAGTAVLTAQIVELASAKRQEQQSRSEPSDGKVFMFVWTIPRTPSLV